MTANLPSFLVINVSRIGDTLFATPALRAIATAHPGCHLTVLSHPKRAEILRGLPFVTELGAITKNTAPWRGHLTGRRYDVAVVFDFDAPLVRYALRVAGRVVAFRQADDAINRRLHCCVEPPPPRSRHAAERLLMLTDALGIPPAGLRIAWRVLPEEADEARARLAADVPAGASPLVGLQVASFPTKPFRDWPIKSFLALAERMRERWPRVHFLLYGGHEERSRVQWLHEHLGAAATFYAGLSLRKTAAIMELTDLYVGVDTGPTHIMSAFDVPLVGLYHCLSPSRCVGPLDHPNAYVIDHPRAAGDCTESVPIAEITVDMVLAVVARALAVHPPAAARFPKPA